MRFASYKVQMKNIFSLFVITVFGSLNSLAYDGFHCIPSLRQTRIQVLTVDNEIEIRVVNPAGYEFMPQFDGSGSQFSLGFNKMQAEDLNEFGEVFVFRWSKEKCKIDTENLTLDCDGEALNKVGNIKSFGVSTTEISEKSRGETYEKRKFRISAEKENIYFVSLEFYKQNCEKFK